MQILVTPDAIEGFLPFDEKLRKISTRGYSLYLHSEAMNTRLLLTTYPGEWVKKYRDSSLYFLDPVVAWSLAKSGTARWSTNSKAMPVMNNYVLSKAEDFGLKFGAVASKRSAQFKKCVLNITRHDRDFTDAELDQLNVIMAEILAAHEAKPGLNRLDVDTIRFLADGLSQDDIAQEMSVTRDAVKKRVEKIRRKLGAKNTTHIVSLALRNNMLI